MDQELLPQTTETLDDAFDIEALHFFRQVDGDINTFHGEVKRLRLELIANDPNFHSDLLDVLNLLCSLKDRVIGISAVRTLCDAIQLLDKTVKWTEARDKAREIRLSRES
ncbi:MAG: hypothetical protein ACKO0Z_25340 [Betaproteobacteria bacterium]